MTSKKSPNVYKSCPKMTPLQKLPKNVGDLGKSIVAEGFKRCPKSNKSPDLVTLPLSSSRSVKLSSRWSISKFPSHFLCQNVPQKRFGNFRYFLCPGKKELEQISPSTTATTTMTTSMASTSVSPQFASRCQCYETCFGENLDFHKIKKLNKQFVLMSKPGARWRWNKAL